VKVIYVVGLGPGDPKALTLRALSVLKHQRQIYVRTAQHPSLALLAKHRIKYKALDYFYRHGSSFEETYRNIAFFVINAALNFGKVVYAVPGSPLFAEKTVELILQKAPLAGVKCCVLPSVSFLEAISADLCLPREEKLQVVDALQEDKLLDYPEKHLLIMQVYNRQIASKVKLRLMELYPDEQLVKVIRKAGMAKGKKILELPLYELDRIPWIDHLTTVYVPPLTEYAMTDLLQVMRVLRSENGCPWDKEQDHQSLKPYLLEEAYEVIGAIDSGNAEELCEELGDLLLQVVFHSEIAAEEKKFSFFDVITAVTEKLIRRHPHVFADTVAKTSQEVLHSWQQIKKAEKKEQDSLFKLETYLPALLRAQKLQRQAASVGFDWPDITGAWGKLQEELKELKDAYKSGLAARIEEELGDVLFATVNVARFLQVDAEQALAAAVEKFYRRLRFVEAQAQREGTEMSAQTLSKLDEWWDLAKKKEKS